MKKQLLAAAAAVSLAAGVVWTEAAPALARGYDIGPLGQCFNPPDCGGRHERDAYAYQCPLLRERVELPSGRLVYRARRVCR